MTTVCCGTVTVVSKLWTTTKNVWKISVATTTPIRFRSCLGTTTRTPTPLRWFVPLSTSLRTANHSSTLKSAWGAVPNNGWYRLCRYEHAVIGTATGYWTQHPSFCGIPWEEGCFYLSAGRKSAERMICSENCAILNLQCPGADALCGWQCCFAGSIMQWGKAYTLIH